MASSGLSTTAAAVGNNSQRIPCDNGGRLSARGLSFVYGIINGFATAEDQKVMDLNYATVLDFLRTNCSSIDLERHLNRSYQEAMSDMFFLDFDMFFYCVATIWVFIGIIGVLGNVIVLIVLLRNSNKLVYEIFCIGLAFTDLVFLCLAVPMTVMHYRFDTWLFGAILCKLANFIVYVTVYVSSLMLLGLTSSRFLAVVHPWKNRKIKVGRAKLACVGAWLIGLSCCFPVLIYYSIVEQYDSQAPESNRTLCTDNGFPSEISRAAYQIFTSLVTCVIPFSSIIVMNTMIVLRLQKEVNKAQGQRVDNMSCREQRKKKLRAKVTKLVIIVTTLYCVCWLPTHVVNTWYNVHRNSFPQTFVMMIIKAISQSLSYAASCVNPIVYSAISGTFKAAIFKQFPRLSRILRRGADGEIEMQRTEMVTYRSTSISRGGRGGELLAEDKRPWRPPHLPNIDGKSFPLEEEEDGSSPMTVTATLACSTFHTNGVVSVFIVAGQPQPHAAAQAEELDQQSQQQQQQQQLQQQSDSSSTAQTQDSQQQQSAQRALQSGATAVGGGKRPTSLPGQPRHQKHSSGSTASASIDPHSSVPSITWSTGSPSAEEPRSPYLRMSAV